MARIEADSIHNGAPSGARTGIRLPEDRYGVKELPDQEKESRGIALAKTISFGRMARALLGDMQDLQLGYAEHLSQFHELVPVPKKKGPGKPRFPGPLAVEVAERELQALGLREYIALKTDTTDEILSKLKDDLKPGEKDALIEMQIQERVKVNGYHWVKLPPVDGRPVLQESLGKKVQDIENAKNDMTELYQGLIDIATRKYRSRGVKKENGALGLAKGIYSYDWRLGFNPGGFIYPLIEFELMREWRDQGHIVRGNRNRDAQRLDLLLVKDAIMEDGAPMTADEVAKRMEIPADEATALLLYDASRGTTISLDAQVTPQNGDSNSSDRTQQDYVETTPGHENDVLDRVLLPDALAHLSERDRKIIKLRFWEGMSQGEIGKEFGIKQSQVSRLLGSALAQLKEIYLAED